MAQAIKKKDVWSKKKWYSVVAPKLFNEKKIADTPALKEKLLVGRTFSTPLSELTGSFRHYQTMVFLRINRVDGNEAYTEYAGQELLRDVLARVVRRWSSRIDSIDDVQTKDGKTIRIKSLAISLKRIDTTLKNKIRKSVSDSVKDYVESSDLDGLVEDIIVGKMQKQIRKNINVVYPLRAMEIRKTEVLA